MSRTIRIGAGAGFSGDRIEPALELVEYGDLDYLAFECLAERTIGLAHAARLRDGRAGFDPLLERRMRTILPVARARGVRIITNMGAANPLGAAEAIVAIAREFGLNGLKVAAVLGDDVADIVGRGDFPLLDRTGTSRDLTDVMVSANAYLGAGGIVAALAQGADVVVTGRVCDPALFVAPMIHEFGWAMDDWELLGRGTLVGHLLECAGQLTGGYFADPGRKDVRGLSRLGFPFADVGEDGLATFSKVAASGGRLDSLTCKEQVLYEVLDPSAYLQADVTADFSGVEVEELGPDLVAVRGGTGHPRPDTLKVSISYEDGWVGQGQICYAGPGAQARAELAFAIVRERLALSGAAVNDLTLDLIGINSLARTGGSTRSEPSEIMARISGRAADQATAECIGAEVEALYTNGPAGGGGASGSTRKVLAVASTLIPRDNVRCRVTMIEA
ncbi:acyclic terpene utilization AtuA family protein [Novosphingobium sp.]|uniref:acyclic terpene utilization AtuA family protein n=1 Tax=Novosphingobium sp. TaxID=1874826 RepID=UPI0035B1E5C5